MMLWKLAALLAGGLMAMQAWTDEFDG
ncbi:MAG: hypothetical protein XFASWVDF_002215, partial [Candidatus Fervidibacter sp.]